MEADFLVERDGNQESDSNVVLYTASMSSYRCPEEVIRKFLDAAAAGDKDGILRYLREDHYVNNMLDHGDFGGKASALMLASRNGHIGCVRLLLNHGADISQLTQHFTKALLNIARQNRLDSFKFRLLAATGLYKGSEEGEIIHSYKEFTDGVLCGDFERVSLLLSELKFSKRVTADGKWEDTLCFLILSGCPVCYVNHILESGCTDVNCYNSRGFTPLISAVVACDLEMIDYLIKKGADVNQAEVVSSVGDLECRWVNTLALTKLDKNGKSSGGFGDDYEDRINDAEFTNCGMLNSDKKSPLMFAVWTGKLEIVKRLLMTGNADMSWLDSRRHDGLPHAIYSGRLNIVEELVLHWRGDSGSSHRDLAASESILFHAVKTGYLDITERLLKVGVDKIAIRDKFRSVFLRAAADGNMCLLNLLLSHGVDVNITGANNFTALMFAARYKHYDCLQFLINNGCDLDLRSLDGQRAVDMAALHSNTRCVKLLIKSHITNNGYELESSTLRKCLLHFAAKNKNCEVLGYLLPLCKNVDEFDCNNRTPLMYAVAEGLIENVNLLLHHGADVNIQNENGESAPLIAVNRSRLKCFKLLIKAGVNTNANANHATDSCSLLFSAASSDDVEFLEILLQIQPQQINAVESCRGRTPLITAVESKRLEHVRLLLKHGADVNMPDFSGTMPIMYAATHAWPEGFQVLLEAGADVEQVDPDGVSLVFYASGSVECMKMLLEEGSVMEYCKNSNRNKLKSIHTTHCGESFHYNCWDVGSLVLLFQYGVFHWGLYDPNGWRKFVTFNRIVFAALQVADSFPPLFENKNGSVVSLLQEAFLENNGIAVRYLIANLFLTIDDYRTIISDSYFRQRVKKLGDEESEVALIFNNLSRQPLRLETLCFLTISSSLSSTSSPSLSPFASSCTMTQSTIVSPIPPPPPQSSSKLPSCNQPKQTRSEKVDSLPLPNRIQSRLKFLPTTVRKLCPKEWSSLILGESSTGQGGDLLTVCNPLHPLERDLIECDKSCVHCCGYGYVVCGEDNTAELPGTT